MADVEQGALVRNSTSNQGSRDDTKPFVHPPVSAKPLVATTFSLNGNFGAVFYIRGEGATSSSANSSYVDITSSQPFTVSAQNFTTLQIGSTPVTGQGKLAYTMQIYSGTSGSPGSAISNKISGVDAAINGKVMTVTARDVANSGGVMTLLITRVAEIVSATEGDVAYNENGQLVFTIN